MLLLSLTWTDLHKKTTIAQTQQHGQQCTALSHKQPWIIPFFWILQKVACFEGLTAVSHTEWHSMFSVGGMSPGWKNASSHISHMTKWVLCTMWWVHISTEDHYGTRHWQGPLYFFYSLSFLGTGPDHLSEPVTDGPATSRIPTILRYQLLRALLRLWAKLMMARWNRIKTDGELEGRKTISPALWRCVTCGSITATKVMKFNEG